MPFGEDGCGEAEHEHDTEMRVKAVALVRKVLDVQTTGLNDFKKDALAYEIARAFVDAGWGRSRRMDW